MSHLLHLDSSLRTDGSRSRKLSAHYANRWRAKNPDGTVTYRDLTVDPVPHLDNISVSADLVAASLFVFLTEGGLLADMPALTARW